MEKLAASLLRSAARRNLTWRAAERCLRAAFGARFWRCAATRHTLSDKLLLRRPVPRNVLPALLRLVLISPPSPSLLPAAAAAVTGAAAEGKAGGEMIMIERHRGAVAAAVADTWQGVSFITSTRPTLNPILLLRASV